MIMVAEEKRIIWPPLTGYRLRPMARSTSYCLWDLAPRRLLPRTDLSGFRRAVCNRNTNLIFVSSILAKACKTFDEKILWKKQKECTTTHHHKCANCYTFETIQVLKISNTGEPKKLKMFYCWLTIKQSELLRTSMSYCGLGFL